MLPNTKAKDKQAKNTNDRYIENNLISFTHSVFWPGYPIHITNQLSKRHIWFE